MCLVFYLGELQIKHKCNSKFNLFKVTENSENIVFENPF